MAAMLDIRAHSQMHLLPIRLPCASISRFMQLSNRNSLQSLVIYVTLLHSLNKYPAAKRLFSNKSRSGLVSTCARVTG
jgi:hypothetical protein